MSLIYSNIINPFPYFSNTLYIRYVFIVFTTFQNTQFTNCHIAFAPPCRIRKLNFFHGFIENNLTRAQFMWPWLWIDLILLQRDSSSLGTRKSDLVMSRIDILWRHERRSQVIQYCKALLQLFYFLSIRLRLNFFFL